MKKQILIFIVLAVFMVSASVSAQYYQYRDSSGNLRFTDDISQVPESQRDDVKEYESVKTKPGAAPFPAAREDGKKAPDAGTWDGQLRITAEELDRENKKLQQTFDELQKQKAALEKKASDKMSPDESRAYNQEIRRLNGKIEQYQKQRNAYVEKMDRFESQFRKNDNGGAE